MIPLVSRFCASLYCLKRSSIPCISLNVFAVSSSMREGLVEEPVQHCTVLNLKSCSVSIEVNTEPLACDSARHVRDRDLNPTCLLSPNPTSYTTPRSKE